MPPTPRRRWRPRSSSTRTTSPTSALHSLSPPCWSVTPSAVSSRNARWYALEPPALAGLALLALPPTGNGPMVGRFLSARALASIKITYAFIAGAFKSNAALCRECFFSENLPEATLRKHMGQIATSCNVRLLDLRSLNDSLPLPAPGPRSPPVCVVGGEDDFVVDVEGLEETAEWGKTEAIVLKDTAHDLMLDTRWEGAAAALEGWMEQKL